MSDGVPFDPNDVHSWIGVLHKAATISRDDPHYAEAQEWKTKALAHIQDINDLQNRRDQAQAKDLGKGAAVALGAARPMSFGLSDVAQKLTLSPEEQAAVEGTAREHPTATTVGTVTGVVGPGLLSLGAGPAIAGASRFAPAALNAAVGRGLTQLGPRGISAALGGLEGVGLTSGGPVERAVGGVEGAIGGYAGAAALQKVAQLRRPLGGLLGRVIGRIAPAEAPPPPIPPSGPAAGPAPTVAREIPAPGFEASPATQEATADIVQATRDLAAGKISQADYDVAVRFARGEPLPPEQGALQAIPGTGGRGLTVEGPPTPAAPTAPTAAEMVTGRSNAPVQLPGGGQVMPAATGVAPSATELAQRAPPMTPPWRRPQTPVGPPAPATPQVAPWQRPMTLEDLRTLPEAPAGPSSLSELSTGKTLPYYPRGGQVEQALPPPPGGPSGLGGPARSVGQIADEMEAQIDLAARLGQEPNVQNLPSLLQRRGLTPQQIQAVGKELLRRSLRRKAG